jgi:hypothetical protein
MQCTPLHPSPLLLLPPQTHIPSQVAASELAMLQARLNEAMGMYDSVKQEAEETAAE